MIIRAVNMFINISTI